MSLLWILGSPKNFGATSPMGYIFLYSWSLMPLSALIFLSRLISLVFSLLVGSVQIFLYVFSSSINSWALSYYIQFFPWWQGLPFYQLSGWPLMGLFLVTQVPRLLPYWCSSWGVWLFQYTSYLSSELFSIVWLQVNAGLFNSSYVIPIGECLGATVKPGPWASNEACALVSGTPDKFLTHFWVVVVDAVVGPCACAPIHVWFERPPLVLWQNHSYFFNCLSKIVLCLHSLNFLINSWHSSNNSWLIKSLSSLIHVSIRILHTSMVLFIHLTLSSISCFSALCMILILLSVLILLFNLKLTGVIFWLKHLRMNLLLFLKSASFFSHCSHLLKMATLSLPNSVSITVWIFFILFILCMYDTWSVFSMNIINFISTQYGHFSFCLYYVCMTQGQFSQWTE